MIWRNSFLSFVRLIYTAPNTMQESSGEMSIAAQIPDSPSSMAITRISRLSRLLAGISRRLRKYPQNAPRPMTRKLQTIGIRMSEACRLPAALPLMMADTTLNASRQTTSSSATICSNVSTNSPFALYWLIVIMVLAGAVAVAIAPRISAKSQLR